MGYTLTHTHTTVPLPLSLSAYREWEENGWLCWRVDVSIDAQHAGEIVASGDDGRPIFRPHSNTSRARFNELIYNTQNRDGISVDEEILSLLLGAEAQIASHLEGADKNTGVYAALYTDHTTLHTVTLHCLPECAGSYPTPEQMRAQPLPEDFHEDFDQAHVWHGPHAGWVRFHSAPAS